ncbi:ParB/RepB/Spo0J family partition protein [Singulisphaera sp. GP187]|uniref:DNA methyltransferase n=1 Tax=Singulisphaera sp. GP187 TaxID=1882752 RepID=UPI0009265D26|nr:DNA methyltransferase [Singulisphaera sp. GP187]SIO56620.1 ParB/RepB/Spo0J family partition protein [Singulisphaera sp. GP187]
MPSTLTPTPAIRLVAPEEIRANPLSISIYGDPAGEIDDLIESVRTQGILVPLAVVHEGSTWELVSGHRRLACARALGLTEVPCEIKSYPSRAARDLAILEYNRQRRKTFTQMMREADAHEELQTAAARRRRLANLRQFQDEASDNGETTDCRNSDDRPGRSDSTLARAIGLGGKDLYRQARAIWKTAKEGDARAVASLTRLDAGTKTIHAAYKDLRRRDRFAAGFRPTPYDVWAFKHDHGFGVPHPGAIPPAIVAHTLHYYTTPNALVVDPMAGGGTVIDVCESMGRRCLAYDIHSVRPDVQERDVKNGFPPETSGCDLIFCDPPYHTMQARQYGAEGIATAPFAAWVDFLNQLARHAFATIRPGGYLALLVANQTEKDLPAGHGYLDHAFYGYAALVAAGFLPERRISCPMDGAYLPQHVRRARTEGRMLGQVRDLLIARKPLADMGLGQGFAAGQFVHFGPQEGVGEGRVPAHDRLRQ